MNHDDETLDRLSSELSRLCKTVSGAVYSSNNLMDIVNSNIALISVYMKMGKDIDTISDALKEANGALTELRNLLKRVNMAVIRADEHNRQSMS